MFIFFNKKYLGIDIGTSAIRLVEISKDKKLENYGEISFKDFDKPFIYSENNSLILSENNIANALKALLQETQTKNREAFFSLADFASFFITFTVPKLKEKELIQAVPFEAKKYIPIPLNNVTLDWQVIEEVKPQKGTEAAYRILALAIPNEIIDQYQRIAAACGIKLLGFEAEVFSLNRALTKTSQDVCCVLDVGTKSTTVTIVDQGIIKDSHSLSFSGWNITNKISQGLGLDEATAEKLKMEAGFTNKDPRVEEVCRPMTNLMLQEVDRIFREFYRASNKKVQRVIVAGGTSLMPGFAEFLSMNFKVEKGVEIANAFSGLKYPPALEESLRVMSPFFSISVGLALKAAEA